MKKVKITCEKVFRFEQIVEMPDEEFEEIKWFETETDIRMMDDGYECINSYIDWNDGDCDDEIRSVEVTELYEDEE